MNRLLYNHDHPTVSQKSVIQQPVGTPRRFDGDTIPRSVVPRDSASANHNGSQSHTGQHQDTVSWTEVAALKEKLEGYQQRYAAWEESLRRDGYVLLLIDGNRMIFDAAYLESGEQGGRAAATSLQMATNRWATSKLGLQELPVLVRIFANLNKLSQLSVAAGIIASPEVMTNFMRGLTDTNSGGNYLCDFVNTCESDAKIDTHLRLHLRSEYCNQIILGCGPASRVVNTLQTHQFDGTLLHRITIINGTDMLSECDHLPLKRVGFEKQLISIDLEEAANQARARQAAAQVVVSPPPASTPPSIKPSTPLWSKIANDAKDLPMKDIPRPSTAVPTDGVRVNAQDQRVDTPTEYDHDRVAHLKTLRLCNQHYLGKGCCHHIKGNDNCPHRHDYVMSKEDLKYFPAVARETVCRRGSACRDLDCIYGHSCPYPKATEGSMRGIGCVNGDTCRFGRALHGIDQRVVRVVKSEH